MSIITIQCRLVAPEASLRHLWELMALKNTPLVNELLDAIAQHPNLETWLQQGKLPTGLIKTLCNSLKTDTCFAGQPGRFYSSAVSLVDHIYKSWFAIQMRKRLSLNGKKRWLGILKSDVELEQEANRSLAEIRTQAQKTLKKLENAQKPPTNKPTKTSLFDALMIAYEQAKTSLERCAIAYLLKNNCSVSEEPENPEAHQKRRRAKEIEIQRLEQQLHMTLPKGRDLSSDRWLDALARASKLILTPEEFVSVQANLLKNNKIVPFTVLFNSNTNLIWFKNNKERICVKFSGLSQYPFEVRCDQRQLHWFQRFLVDYENYLSHRKQLTTGLFSLRSAFLIWKEGKGKGNPWEIHRLSLHCSVETLLWSAEGTEQIRAQKIAQTEKIIQKYQEKSELNLNQERNFRGCQTSLNLLKKSQNISCPNHPIYQGNPSIVVGVCIVLSQPVTVAVVNTETKQAIVYRSTKQLLNQKIAKNKEETQYELIKRWESQQKNNLNKRYQAQQKGLPCQCRESNLGLYINRLLAKSIVDIARQYQSGMIVLPNLENIKEMLESEISAFAELKIPGNKKAQNLYAKEFRIKIHRWNYKQLTDCVRLKADKEGIGIEVRKQNALGNSQEKAKNLALSIYQHFAP
jgi:IS605 OrfB family transposase